MADPDVFDPKQIELMSRLTAALVGYTPPHFKTIQCVITEGLEDKQRALFYTIRCPEYPDDGTTVVNATVHDAGTALVRYMTREGAAFPGLRITMTQQADGKWHNNIKLMDAMPDKEPPKGPAQRPVPRRTPPPRAPAKPWWKLW